MRERLSFDRFRKKTLVLIHRIRDHAIRISIRGEIKEEKIKEIICEEREN